MKQINYSRVIEEISEAFEAGENPFESCPFFDVRKLDFLFDIPRKDFQLAFVNAIPFLMKRVSKDPVGEFFMHCKMKTYPTNNPLERTSFNEAEQLANMRLDFGKVKYGVALGPSQRISRIDALQEIDMLNYCRIFLDTEDLEKVSELLNQVVKIILR